MSEWWTKGYPGGKMIDLPGFPRPLFPPDVQRHIRRRLTVRTLWPINALFRA